jgi:hypothetical protein
MSPIGTRMLMRQRALLLALLFSLGATAWVASQEEAIQPQDKATTTPSASVRKDAAALAKHSSPLGWPQALPASSRSAWDAPGAVASQSWGISAAATASAVALEAVPPTLPAAELAATAPALSYQLVGRIDDERSRVVLTNARHSVVLGVGELLDAQWRIDSIDAAGITLSWLPGRQKQTLLFQNP